MGCKCKWRRRVKLSWEDGRCEMMDSTLWMGGLFFVALCGHISNNTAAQDNGGKIMEQRWTHNTGRQSTTKPCEFLYIWLHIYACVCLYYPEYYITKLYLCLSILQLLKTHVATGKDHYPTTWQWRRQTRTFPSSERSWPPAGAAVRWPPPGSRRARPGRRTSRTTRPRRPGSPVRPSAGIPPWPGWST